MTYQEAYNFCEEKRSSIDPNEGFIGQLKRFRRRKSPPKKVEKVEVVKEEIHKEESEEEILEMDKATYSNPTFVKLSLKNSTMG